MALEQDFTRYICLFRGAEHAQEALRALQAAGFTGVDTVGNETGTTGDQTLGSLQVPDADRKHLEDGLRRGGVVISLEAPEDRSSEIERIFHHHSAEKIDEADVQRSAPVGATLPLAAVSENNNAAGQAVVPVVQESLQVGKQEVTRGGARVYRRTVDEPVSESVRLHEERIALEYRETNRPATHADFRAGSQTFELIETAEVPVVEKRARVVEEVHVGKVETERTEVVQDSVRRTEVQVVDIAGERSNLPGRRS